MKKIKVNSMLLKHLVFILIYLTLLRYPLNNITNAIVAFGTSASLTRLYERFYLSSEFFLMVAILMGIVLIYTILFFLFNFYRYVRLFFETFSKRDLWVILISDEENIDLSSGEITEQSPKDEEDMFKRCIRTNFHCLIFLYVISVAMSILLAFTSSIIG